MCHSNGSLFHKKSLSMDPIFYKNIPIYGSLFPQFLDVHMQTPKNCENFEKWVCISRKIHINEYLMMTLKTGMGFKALATCIPPSKPNLRTTPAVVPSYCVSLVWYYHPFPNNIENDFIELNLQYHAYVAYNDESADDTAWVMNALQPNMEEGPEPLQLFIKSRDAIAVG